MRRIVPLVLSLIVVLPGCYLSHELTSRVARDAGPFASDAHALRDAGPLDGGATDAAPVPCSYEPLAARRVTDLPHSAHAPELGWDGEQLGLVIFESDGDDLPHPIVSLVRVTPDLAAHTAPVMIGEESHGWGEAVWSGTSLALCWNTDPGFVGRTGFRVHDRAGTAISARVDLDFDGEACTALAGSDAGHAAAWRHRGEDETIVTSAQWIDRDGRLVGERVALASAPYPGRSTSLAIAREGFVATVAEPDRGVRIVALDRDGTAREITTIAHPNASYSDVTPGHAGHGLVFLAGEPDLRGLFFVALGADLAPSGAPSVIAPEGSGARSPEIVATPDGWAVIWVERREGATTRAMLAHLAPEGAPLEPHRVVHDGENSGYGGPALLARGSDLYVAIAHPRAESPTGYEQAHVLRFRCERDAHDGVR